MSSSRLIVVRMHVTLAHLASHHRATAQLAETATVGPDNQMVCEPYPLAMNAMLHVDQAAAVIVTSLATTYVSRSRNEEPMSERSDVKVHQ
jgi:acetyl-CoA C-acetyltransferase